MATIVLSAAGMALGGSLGGSVLGLSTAVLGRAAGAMVGRAIDERLLGQGSAPVETGRIDRFRLTGASEGAAIGRVWGRMRVAGQVIWAGDFEEHTDSSGGGGKGVPRGPRITEYSYSVSLAIALCEGEITHVGRIWADGAEIAPSSLNLRVYHGTEDQEPDPAMVAVLGEGRVPAYRGTAYVVLEDLDLAPFGNRIPQLSFEVFRPATEGSLAAAEDMAHLLRGVALIPGTGEYSLATSPVFLERGYGETVPVNVNTPTGQSDFLTSMDSLNGELPNARSLSLVVSWFGDDLRAGECTMRPKVEQTETDASAMPWRVSGLDREAADLVARVADRPVYGGTPADAAVSEAIRELNARRMKVMFYPFILMEQLADNTLPNPWTGSAGQPPLPWRGRITTALAPGMEGTTDGTAAAEADVAAFFGTAAPEDFAVDGDRVSYTGPTDWGLRRMILHYAHLCAAAGGVDSFCIGSEMVALTQIRGAGGSFPAVAAFRALAADVRSVLGPDCKLGYAADWSEYHGYQPPGTNDKLFHLDPLWADAEIDFIGIDNYMPLSDWRDGEVHADADKGSIYDLDYLGGNVAGGELYDWFYHSPEARDAQIRTPITDGDGEPWVWRTKDIQGWWSNPHHDRIDGARQAAPTEWEPRSKPIWFTELGCAAIDKGTNQPNKFLDPKSSESSLPFYSTGLRDELIQIQYLRAIHRYYAAPANNPASDQYDGRMLDMSRAHVWAWDARPWPAFPARSDLWSDGDNYARGHWLNGRSAGRTLASVVTEICADSGVTRIDTTRLHGHVRGFRQDDTGTARGALQPLMLAHGFDAVERDGLLQFVTRTGHLDATVDPARLAVDPEAEHDLDQTRASAAEISGRVRLQHIGADGIYEMAAVEARFPDDGSVGVSQSELPLTLTRAEGRRIAERWLAEARVARDGLRLSLPPSRLDLGAGDVFALDGAPGRWRIDRLEATGQQALDAVRVEPAIYVAHETGDEQGAPVTFAPPVPVEAVFLDLPLLTGDEVPHAPHAAFVSRPWPGPVGLSSSADDSDYALDRVFAAPATIGTTLSPMFQGIPGLWDRGPALRVRLVRGSLSSVSTARLLAGANAMAIGTGAADYWEVFQFAQAELVAPDTWDIRMRLRGQSGSDGIMPLDWPAGSRIVLLDRVPKQIALSLNDRAASRHYRWGPASRPIDDPTWRHREIAFAGIGLRPYSVCHLRAAPAAGGALDIGWIRRSRIGGDSWDVPEIPLGEEHESYILRVVVNGVTVRELTLASPQWHYPAAQRAADGAQADCRIEVAQVSATFGPGPFEAVEVAG